MKSTGTTGSNAVDWEERVDFERLRDTRLARLKAQLDGSDMGAVLAFDFSNIRYMSATHIGTWAMDKLIRFALLTRNTDPIVWDFGSAAKHHKLYNPWLDFTTAEMDADPNAPHEGAKRPRLESGARAGISTLRGGFPPEAGIAEGVAKKIKRELEKFGVADQPLGVDVIELPILFALQKEGIEVVDGQQVFMEARRIKTPDEIRLLTQAASMVDAAYEELYRFLRPGVRENEAVGVVAKTLYDLGSEYVEGVNAISGERCSPHPHVFSDRLIRPGDPAFFDILHSFNGYRTCYYRTFAVGSASSAQRDAYTRAREYMDRAIALVKPGATTADIVEVWPTAQEFGFADEEAAFALQYGHGVGLSIWGKPIFSRLTSLDHPEELQEGMLFALETYWPSADGWGAARIEEEVVVTADGCEVITKFPAEELLVAGQRYYSVGGPLDLTRDSQSHLNTTWGRGEA
jgi:Xaa-Pro aminopeptidase